MATDLIELALADIGEHFARYRLRSAAAERVLQASLRRYGQMSPVVVFPWQGRHELVDGFKRLAAARAVSEWTSLCARVIEADERTAKAAIYGLNRASGKTSSWKKRGSSMRWCARTGCRRWRSPTSWAGIRAGSVAAWRSSRSSASRRKRS